jgi:peptidoglycan hydrolase CwlO-like protein
MRRLPVFILIFSVIGFLLVRTSLAQTSDSPTSTPTPTPDKSAQTRDLQNQISDLQAKISKLKSEETTLKSQMAVMDNQIALTQLKINSTEKQISDLTLDIDTADKKIDKLEGSLDKLSEVLINRIKATYVVGSTSEFQVLLSSDNVHDFVERANYLRLAQQHDKQLIYDTVQARNDYAAQKDIYEDEKTKAQRLQEELATYKAQLDVEKQNKARLLAETQGSESNYQRLLTQARAQLEGFSEFASSQGGASILSNQTQCDDWGCYYNQRDGQWGSNSLNGTGYTLASDGCLVTSMAMIYTHYGHRGVNPQTINSNPSNFASYYPAYLLKVISANGVTTSRVYDAIDSVLSSGHPVVVGISYDNGPIADHFVVFSSGSSGTYNMKDPFTPNGNNIDFRTRYPTARIVDVEKVVF